MAMGTTAREETAIIYDLLMPQVLEPLVANIKWALVESFAAGYKSGYATGEREGYLLKRGNIPFGKDDPPQEDLGQLLKEEKEKAVDGFVDEIVLKMHNQLRGADPAI